MQPQKHLLVSMSAAAQYDHMGPSQQYFEIFVANCHCPSKHDDVVEFTTNRINTVAKALL